MKRSVINIAILLAIQTIFVAASYSQQGVVIGSSALSATPTPDPNAILWLIGDGKQGLILPIVAGTSAVATPAKGMVVYNSADNSIYYYNGTWAPVGGSGGTSVATLLKIKGNDISIDPAGTASIKLANADPATAGQILMWDGGKWVASSATAPTAGQVLTWNAVNNQWEPKPIVAGDLLSSKNLSDLQSAATARQNLGLGTIPYTWPAVNAVGALQNNGSGTLTWSPLSIAGTAAGGDLSGTYPNPTIANNSVTSAKILDGTITGNDLSGGINISTTGSITTTGNINAANATITGNVNAANIIATGSVTSAASFSGPGTNITALNANNISSGTLTIGHGGTGSTAFAANAVPRSTGAVLQAGIITDNGSSVGIGGDVAVTGYTQLGAGSPSIQVVQITGTNTSGVVDGTVAIALPVDVSRIVFVNVFVTDAAGEVIPPMYLRTSFQTYAYTYFVVGTTMTVVNLDTSPFGSSSIRGRPISVTLGFHP